MTALSNIEKLDSLHPDIVFNFLDTGTSSAIAKPMQDFIMQIQWASEIWEIERNTTRAAKKLKERVYVHQKTKLNIVTCKARIFQAMEYFDVDHNLPQEIWDRNAADKFEDLMKLAIAQDKLTEAGRFLEKANELRRRANEALNISDLQMPQFLITTNISPEDLGYTNKNMLEISKKATDGFYIKMINELPVSKEDKKRLFKDADVEDVSFEEIDD
jgi:hypothetical protein